MNKFDTLTREQLRKAWAAVHDAYKVTNDTRLRPVLDELLLTLTLSRPTNQKQRKGKK